MSSAHRTALAKLPDAIAWLVGALGGAGIGGSGGGGSQEGTSSGRCGDSLAGKGSNVLHAAILWPTWLSVRALGV